MTEDRERVARELESWAQNEEMVDQRYTEHGKVCNEAVALLRESAPEGEGLGEFRDFLAALLEAAGVETTDTQESDDE